MTGKRGAWFAGPAVPQSHGTIGSGGGELCAVRAECDRVDRSRVAGKATLERQTGGQRERLLSVGGGFEAVRFHGKERSQIGLCLDQRLGLDSELPGQGESTRAFGGMLLLDRPPTLLP